MEKVTLSCRVTHKDRAVIEEAAKAAGVSVAKYVEMAAIGHRNVETTNKIQAETINKLHNQLRTQQYNHGHFEKRALALEQNFAKALFLDEKESRAAIEQAFRKLRKHYPNYSIDELILGAFRAALLSKQSLWRVYTLDEVLEIISPSKPKKP